MLLKSPNTESFLFYIFTFLVLPVLAQCKSRYEVSRIWSLAKNNSKKLFMLILNFTPKNTWLKLWIYDSKSTASHESAKVLILHDLAPTHLTHHWYVSLLWIESGKLRVLPALAPYPSLILALRALGIIKYASARLHASTQINRYLTRLCYVVLPQLKSKVCFLCSLQLNIHLPSLSPFFYFTI